MDVRLRTGSGCSIISTQTPPGPRARGRGERRGDKSPVLTFETTAMRLEDGGGGDGRDPGGVGGEEGKKQLRKIRAG